MHSIFERAKESRSLGLIYSGFLFFQYHCRHVKALRAKGYILQGVYVAKSDDWASNCLVSCQSVVSITTSNVWLINRDPLKLQNWAKFGTIKWNSVRQQCFWNVKVFTSVVVDWFWDPIEEEASAESTGEEHAEPEVWEWVWRCTKAEGPISTRASWTPCSGSYFGAILDSKSTAKVQK